MGQTAYSLYTGPGFAGLIADAVDNLIESIVAYEVVNFGRGLISYAGDSDVMMGLRDVATLVFSTAFSGSNVTAITVNGSSVAPITFSSTSVAMQAAVLAAIQACPAVTFASESGLTYTIRTKGVQANVVASVSGGSAVTTTVDNVAPSAAHMIFKGISVQRNTQGTGHILADEVVDVMRKGRVWVDCTTATTIDAPAYVDLADGTGKFTTVSTNNLSTGGVFKMATTGAGLSVVEINLP